MASSKLSATILILSLLTYSTFTTEACGGTPCKPPAPVKPKPCPPPPVKPKPCTTPPAVKHCPTDTLKLGVCADLLGLVNVVIGTPSSTKCCALLEGLADLDAALCLCTAIEANVLGINLNVPLSLSLLLSACQKIVPPGFQCA